MSNLAPCPQCNSEYSYVDGTQLVCPECGHEWPADASVENADDTRVVKDSVGNPLHDGDTITVIKDLKVKGSSSVLKKGSKIKGIRLVDGADGHNVDCKTELGSMLLKSEFLKKA